MTTTHIDPVQFGRMAHAMEQLTKELAHTRASLEAHNDRIEFLESRYAIGKWGIGGLVLMVGFAIFGVKETLHTIWRVISG